MIDFETYKQHTLTGKVKAIIIETEKRYGRENVVDILAAAFSMAAIIERKYDWVKIAKAHSEAMGTAIVMNEVLCKAM